IPRTVALPRGRNTKRLSKCISCHGDIVGRQGETWRVKKRLEIFHSTIRNLPLQMGNDASAIDQREAGEMRRSAALNAGIELSLRECVIQSVSHPSSRTL